FRLSFWFFWFCVLCVLFGLCYRRDISARGVGALLRLAVPARVCAFRRIRWGTPANAILRRPRLLGLRLRFGLGVRLGLRRGCGRFFGCWGGLRGRFRLGLGCGFGVAGLLVDE